MRIHDYIIITVVTIIIGIQLFMFFKNLKRIIAYKEIIPYTDQLSLVEVAIDEEAIPVIDPEYILDKKELFSPNYVDSNTLEESTESKIHNENAEKEDYTLEIENKDVDEIKNLNDEDDLTLFN